VYVDICASASVKGMVIHIGAAFCSSLPGRNAYGDHMDSMGGIPSIIYSMCYGPFGVPSLGGSIMHRVFYCLQFLYDLFHPPSLLRT
jgi:hypothetical protein